MTSNRHETATDAAVHILPVAGLPEVEPGDDLETMIADAIIASTGGLREGDIVVVTHKVVSKAEGQVRDLGSVTPSPFARSWAEQWGKDPRQVEVVLSESKKIVRMHRGLIIAETRHGFICANAGVDASNAGDDAVVLLPRDPDGTAASLREALTRRFFPDAAPDDRPIAVIITDSFGRAWRNGIVNVAIGVSGINPFVDYRGEYDPAGYELRATVLAVADEIAAAAELVMHKIHRRPVAVIRGYERQGVQGDGAGADLVMPEERNLFP
jgi:coenzyme F420-0:L-glutamate ligase / coenzyme F420-1:gamma-L-glutamate ligase